LVQFIESQFDDLYCKLKKENFLADITDKEEMSERLAYYLGEINMIHPFREGNGRTQRIYIEQLCLNNGRFEID
jgi:cell filamentation protein